jgi:bifunctional DNA-binding transcriptional regulator/antitoxin component of YhaV-PrlF toxin-antitoxin module
MAKVTSKLQVTVPKVIAERYRIKPGDEITWLAAGDSIRVVKEGAAASKAGSASRLRLFDEATRRQQLRDKAASGASGPRGWTREDLYDDIYDDIYDRGRPR